MTRRLSIQYLSLLLGGSISAPVMAGLRSEKRQVLTNFSFTLSQETLIAEIADVIIPSTDTPGAKAAGVEKFIIRIVKDCYTPAQQQQFEGGLVLIENESQAKYTKNFEALDFVQKTEIVKQITQSNKPFFHQIKELTVIGYFTSEIGATKALAYQPVPGRFMGCMPLKAGQKAWAL